MSVDSFVMGEISIIFRRINMIEAFSMRKLMLNGENSALKFYYFKFFTGDFCWASEGKRRCQIEKFVDGLEKL